MKNLYLFVLLFFLGLAPHTQAEVVPQELSDTLSIYRQSGSMILEVRKTVKNPILEKETTFKGIIRFQKGKFYWETTEPEKNLVIYDGKTLWNIQYPPIEMKEAPLQIAKTKVRSKKNSPIILAEIFGTRPIQSVFDVKQKSKDGALFVYELKEKKTEFGLKNLLMKVDVKAQRIATLEYLDEVENEVKIEFRSTQFDVKIKQSLFKYTPPKNALVTEI